jgi:hypothetical protein
MSRFVDGVRVHYDPPVPAQVSGERCGEIGVPHVDVWPDAWIAGDDRGEAGETPHVRVEVYLGGYERHGDTYRRDRDTVWVRPPGRLMRLLGHDLECQVEDAIRSRAAIVRRLTRDQREVQAIRASR